MPLLSPADQAQLQQDFAQVTRPVKLLFFSQTFDCDTCLPTRQILDELPPLSPHVTVEEVNFVLEKERAARFGIDRVPAIALVTEDEQGQERDSHIRFLGMPAGYEFVSLIRAVVLVGGGTPLLSEQGRAMVAAVDRPMTLHVFTTPTCPHCPRAVVLAHEMAWANPNLTTFAVEATEYPDLARKYRVTGVPKTVVDDTIEILGAIPEEAFIQQALSGFTGAMPADADQAAP